MAAQDSEKSSSYSSRSGPAIDTVALIIGIGFISGPISLLIIRNPPE